MYSKCILVYSSVLEMYMEFQEEAYSIALHPTGLYILVGFSDRLRLMNLLIDDISTFKEFNIRGCREVSLFRMSALGFGLKIDIFLLLVCI